MERAVEHLERSASREGGGCELIEIASDRMIERTIERSTRRESVRIHQTAPMGGEAKSYHCYLRYRSGSKRKDRNADAAGVTCEPHS